jgi:hypothetical protein
MNKKLFILIAAVLVVVTLFLVIMIMALEQRREALENPTPTIAPSPTDRVVRGRQPTNVPTIVGEQPLAVVQTYPEDKAIGVPVDATIEITFNKPFEYKDFIYAMAPETEYQLRTAIGNRITVTFPKGLQPSTVYTFKVNTLEQLPRTYTFTTAGTDPVEAPNTYPTGAAEVEEEFMRSENPDVFLRNNTPYEQAEFSVTSVYDERKSDFVFTVTAKSTDRLRAREAFITWMQSLGMTNDDISKLQVTYR